MKFTINTPVTYDVYYLRLAIPIDPLENPDVPLASNDGTWWEVEIELATGRILQWPYDRPVDIYQKVRDEGIYQLLDINSRSVRAISGCYVPNKLLPGSDEDYLNLRINSNGVIANWPNRPNLSDFNQT